MSSIILASKTFDTNGQALFADLTGDFNPIHMDPIAARRTQAGTVVVHGIHAILWALDTLIELGVITEQINSVKVQFTNFIHVGRQVELKLLGRDEKSVRAELSLGTLTTTIVIVVLGTRSRIEENQLPVGERRLSASEQPADFDRLEEMAKLGGWVDAAGSVKQIQQYFPHASSAMGCSRVTVIALLSTLVGMICPGLHSLFAGFAIELVENSRDQDRLGFQVVDTDERFRMVRMSVFGAGIRGSVQAFLRWPPIAQASLRDIMNIVDPTEFAGSTALVVGGSRGLGALTAKILTAGGGKVIFTYATGRADAEKLIEEIRSQTANEVCRAFRYNIHEDAATQLERLGTSITHMYYFATGNIGRQKESLFVTSLFEEFIQMYVKGFYDCCCSLGEHQPQAVTAFYPSSIFVESSPPAMTEYSMAKIAGEMLCANMNRAGGRVHVIVSRLPRLWTDQTATVLPLERSDPLTVMLPVVRKVQLSRQLRVDSGVI
jgi:acyl dehydratase/NAD(P)-dependent dehydrogenase (short-subunit alcohol dehydrogenase family)